MTETAQKPRILITGANGRLGRLLHRAWHQWIGAPVQPVFAARRPPADLLLDMNAPLHDLPVCDTVVALWGQTRSDATALEQNVSLAGATRAVARACGARRVLHLSSAAVYGPGVDLSEDTAPTPHTPYGQSKLAMEARVADFASDTARHVCLRLANVVGADSLAPALTAQDPVRLDRFEDGTGPLRSYISPGDLARILSALALLPVAGLPGILNIAAPDPVAMADLARAAGRDICWQTAPGGASQKVTLKTRRLTGLLPQVGLHRRAEDMIADWQRLRNPE